MKAFTKKHKTEILFFLIIFAFTLASTLFYGNDRLFLFINRHQNSILTLTMPYFTAFVETKGIIVLAIIMLFLNFRLFYAGLFSILVSSVVAQIIKHTIPGANYRPAEYFKTITDLNFIPDTDINYFYSFPSGHTTAAFTIFTLLAFFVANKYLKCTMLVLAAVVGFSRVYLAQHFPADIAGGEILGFFSAFLFYYIFFEKFPAKQA